MESGHFGSQVGTITSFFPLCDPMLVHWNHPHFSRNEHAFVLIIAQCLVTRATSLLHMDILSYYILFSDK